MVRLEHLTLDASSGDVACRVLRIQLLGGLIRYTVQSGRLAGGHPRRDHACAADSRGGCRCVLAHSSGRRRALSPLNRGRRFIVDIHRACARPS